MKRLLPGAGYDLYETGDGVSLTIDKFIPRYEKVFETVREKSITGDTSVIGDFDHLNYRESKQNT